MAEVTAEQVRDRCQKLHALMMAAAKELKVRQFILHVEFEDREDATSGISQCNAMMEANTAGHLYAKLPGPLKEMMKARILADDFEKRGD